MNHFFRSFCGSALLVLLLVEPLSAANIQYTLTLDGTPAGGTFTLEMDELDGPGDNAGIASYTATLSGGLTDIQHVSPNGNVFDLPAFEPRGPVGFTLFRTADGAVDNVAPGVTRVDASQDTVTPTDHIVLNVGHQPDDLNNYLVSDGDTDVETLLGAEGNPYLENVLVATGTWSGALPSFVTGGGGVFNLGATQETFSVNTSPQISFVTVSNVIPEPSTIALLGIGAFGLTVVAYRRRRKRAA